MTPPSRRLILLAGAVAACRRAGTAPEPAVPAPSAAHHDLARQLVHIHDGLRTVLDRLAGHAARAEVDALADYTRLAASFLLGHHDVEDQVLFPALRRAGRLRSADVAFLDACVAEHRAIHVACLGLRAHADAALASPGWRADLERRARDLTAALAPHLAAEEAVLTAPTLAAMISGDELVALVGGPGPAGRADAERLRDHPLSAPPA
jgi:hypothetical protein